MNEQPGTQVSGSSTHQRIIAGTPSQLLSRYILNFFVIGLVDCLLAVCLFITVIVLIALVVLIVEELTENPIHFYLPATLSVILAVLLVGPLFVLQRFLITNFHHLKKHILDLMQAGLEKKST